MSEAPASVSKLYQSFTFKSGSHLFEYKGYQDLTFSACNSFEDPDISEQARSVAESYIDDIAERVKLAKKNKQSKQKVISDDKSIQLHDLFCRLYNSKYGRKHNEINYDVFKIQIKNYGVWLMKHAVNYYFDELTIPSDSKVKTHTFNYFINQLEVIMTDLNQFALR
jgi:hypothetical protein